MIWGWPVILYLFLGGMAAGAALAAGLLSRLGGPRYRPAEQAGALIAAAAATIGTLLLILDLGIGRWKPWRLVFLYLNWRSPMTWGTWILTLFVPVTLLLALALTTTGPRSRLLATVVTLARRLEGVLRGLTVVLAVALGTYTGLLLSAVSTYPLWRTWLLPVLFAVSSASTGLSAALIGGLARDRGLATDLHQLNRTHVALIVVELVALTAWLGSVASSSVAGSQSVALLIGGALAPLFWVGVVLIGLVGPAGLFAYAHGAGRRATVMALSGDAGVLAGGLVLRFLVLAAVVPVLTGPGL